MIDACSSIDASDLSLFANYPELAKFQDTKIETTISTKLLYLFEIVSYVM